MRRGGNIFLNLFFKFYKNGGHSKDKSLVFPTVKELFLNIKILKGAKALQIVVQF